MAIHIILASQSPYRRAQLQQLGVTFEQLSADIDETPLPDESVECYVQRLALAKARKIATQHPSSWVIGSDQACVINGEITSKPLNFNMACAQLEQCSGQSVTFYSAITLLNLDARHQSTSLVPFHVVFRTLERNEIERYIEREEPFDCAGSFKVEGLGIHLFEKLEGHDFNSLIGLPLIELCRMFRKAGINLLMEYQ